MGLGDAGLDLDRIDCAIAVAGAWHAGIACAAYRPLALGGNLLAHGLGQRHGLVQGGQDVVRMQLLPRVEGVVERADDRLLDFGAAEVLA